MRKFRVHWYQGYRDGSESYRTSEVEALTAQKASWHIYETELYSCEGGVVKVEEIGGDSNPAG